MANADVTAEQVRQALSYDPETGVFTWLRTVKDRKTRGGHHYSHPAKPNEKGYIRISIEGKRYMAHRLAWLYVHGEWPKDDIDHINGNRSDNRIANLRDIPHKQNSQNRRRANVTSKTGLLGINPGWGGKKWVATIKVDGRTVSLGTYETPEAAHQAFITAKRIHHQGCTI
jgi:hypothetical protein